MPKRVYKTHNGRYAVGVFDKKEFLKKAHGTNPEGYKTKESARRALKRVR